jgi:hypothetical protein
MSYQVRHDTEFEGKKSNHPYVWYLVITSGLFGFLILMAYLAWTNGWVPTR